MFLPRNQLRISITTSCNMKCVYCHNEGNVRHAMLKIEQIKSILDAAVKLNIKSVRITGGDPLVHPQFYEICKIISQDYKLDLEINTNCVAFDKLIEVVKNNWVSRVIVGLDYFNASISKNSPIGNSSKTILDRVLTLKNLGVNVCIDTVFDGNVENIANLVEWSIKNKIRIKILEVAKNEIAKTSDKSYLSMREYIINKFKLDYRKDELDEVNGYNKDFRNVSFLHSLCRIRRCDLCKKIQMRISSEGIIKPCVFYSTDDIDIFDGDVYDNLCKAIKKEPNFYYNKNLIVEE